jgi:hypothetical protein
MIQTQPDDAPRRGGAGVSVLGWLGAIPLGLTSVVSDALQRFGELPLFHTIVLCLLVLAFIYRDTIHTIMVERFVK